MVLELPFLALVVVYLIEEVGIEVRPFLEGELLAEESRCHVPGNEGSLNQQRAAAAHGVDEIGVALPAGEQDHACRQHLVQRGLDTLLAIAAPMERLAAGVEAQRTLVLGDMHVQADVRIGHGDVGALARLLAELIHDGILYLI